MLVFLLKLETFIVQYNDRPRSTVSDVTDHISCEQIDVSGRDSRMSSTRTSLLRRISLERR